MLNTMVHFVKKVSNIVLACFFLFNQNSSHFYIFFVVVEVNECKFNNPCKNGGTCHFQNETTICECSNSFTGKFCETSNFF